MSDGDRRAQILQAAFKVIQDGGLPFISHDQIARESGVSRQLIRYYFYGKDDIMLGLCDHVAAAYRAALIDVALTTDKADRLEQLLDFYFDFLDGQLKPKDDQVYDALMGLAAGSKRVRDNLAGQYGLLGNVVSQEITVKYPTIAVEDADQLSFLFVCLMYGHWKMVATLGYSPNHRQVTRRAIDRLIASYVSEPSRSDEQPKIWSKD